MTIGIFDSGIGGMTLVEHLHARHPNLPITYYGDTAFTPYGNKSPSWIRTRTLEIALLLEKSGVSCIVVGCGTASVCALNFLQENLSIPVYGVIKPLVKATTGKKIALLATKTTVSSGKLASLIQKNLPNSLVESFACPEFVPLLESWNSHPFHVEQIVERALNRIWDHDTIVLGCTHYPLLSKIIKEKMGPKIFLIDIAKVTAKALSETVFSFYHKKEENVLKIMVSKDPIKFQSTLKQHFPQYDMIVPKIALTPAFT